MASCDLTWIIKALKKSQIREFVQVVPQLEQIQL